MIGPGPSTELSETPSIPLLPRDRGLASPSMEGPESSNSEGSPRRSDRENGASRILPIPSVGRVFRARRRVRLGEVDASGRLRLDSVARFLQDIATDDSEDLGHQEGQAWVVRRTMLEQRRAPHNGDDLDLTTFCSGMGGRWAERRISIAGPDRASIETVTLWVHLDPVTGRPKALSESFHAAYDEARAGREVTARQVHEAVAAEDPDAHSMPWWPRVTDLDVLDHVNNAIAWAVVEQVVARARARELIHIDPAGEFRAEVEFRDAVDRATVLAGVPLTVIYRVVGDVLDIALWSSDGETVHVTAQVAPLV